MAMSTMEVGQKLVELCRAGQYMEAIDALYAPGIVSLEASTMPNAPARLEGLAAVRRKTESFLSTNEIHGGEVKGPWPHGDRFIVYMKLDVTAKAGPMAGRRMEFDEACLYTVADGKIVREEFFYHMPG